MDDFTTAEIDTARRAFSCGSPPRNSECSQAILMGARRGFFLFAILRDSLSRNPSNFYRVAIDVYRLEETFMSRHFAFITLTACLVFLALPSLAKSDDQGDRVCIYKHENFHGGEKCYRPGGELPDLKHTGIASIRVYGHARALLYEDRDFRGRMMEFTTDMPDLRGVPISGLKTWRDHVGSLRVTSDYAYNREGIFKSDSESLRYKPYPLVDPPDKSVCVYEKPNYEGRYQCWASGTDIPNLGLSDWDGRISSVRVFGNGRLLAFTNKNFGGNQIVVDHDSPDLALFPAGTSGDSNHEISSIEVR
jgi:hypothetical protein